MRSKRLYPVRQPSGSPANLFHVLSPSLSYKKLTWDSNVGHTDKTSEADTGGRSGTSSRGKCRQNNQATEYAGDVGSRF